jgi:hypothetical protein
MASDWSADHGDSYQLPVFVDDADGEFVSDGSFVVPVVLIDVFAGFFKTDWDNCEFLLVAHWFSRPRGG